MRDLQLVCLLDTAVEPIGHHQVPNPHLGVAGRLSCRHQVGIGVAAEQPGLLDAHHCTSSEDNGYSASRRLLNV